MLLVDVADARNLPINIFNKRVNIQPLLTPKAIARGVCGHLLLMTKYYL
jgi:hypothetical protein